MMNIELVNMGTKNIHDDDFWNLRDNTNNIYTDDFKAWVSMPGSMLAQWDTYDAQHVDDSLIVANGLLNRGSDYEFYMNNNATIMASRITNVDNTPDKVHSSMIDSSQYRIVVDYNNNDPIVIVNHIFNMEYYPFASSGSINFDPSESDFSNSAMIKQNKDNAEAIDLTLCLSKVGSGGNGNNYFEILNLDSSYKIDDYSKSIVFKPYNIEKFLIENYRDGNKGIVPVMSVNIHQHPIS